MLVLSRRVGERLIVNGNIVIEILEVRSNRCVTVGVTAPRDISIVRQEVLDHLTPEDRRLAGQVVLVPAKQP